MDTKPLVYDFYAWCSTRFGPRFAIEPDFLYNNDSREIYHVSSATGKRVVLHTLEDDWDYAHVDIDGVLDYMAAGGERSQWVVVGPAEHVREAKKISDQIVDLQVKLLQMIDTEADRS